MYLLKRKMLIVAILLFLTISYALGQEKNTLSVDFDAWNPFYDSSTENLEKPLINEVFDIVSLQSGSEATITYTLDHISMSINLTQAYGKTPESPHEQDYIPRFSEQSITTAGQLYFSDPFSISWEYQWANETTVNESGKAFVIDSNFISVLGFKYERNGWDFGVSIHRLFALEFEPPEIIIEDSFIGEILPIEELLLRPQNNTSIQVRIAHSF